MLEIVAAYLIGVLTGLGVIGYYAKKKLEKLKSGNPLAEMAEGMGDMMAELQDLEDPEDDN